MKLVFIYIYVYILKELFLSRGMKFPRCPPPHTNILETVSFREEYGMEEEGEAIERNVSWISQLKAHWLAERDLVGPPTAARPFLS